MSEFSIPHIEDYSNQREKNNKPHPAINTIIAFSLLGLTTWAGVEAYKALHPPVHYDISNMPEYTQTEDSSSDLDFENNEFINIRKVEFNNGEPTVPLTPTGKDTSGVIKSITKDEAKDYVLLSTKPFKSNGPGLTKGALDDAYVLIGKIEKQSNDSSLFITFGAVNYNVLNEKGQAKVEKNYKVAGTDDSLTQNL